MTFTENEVRTIKAVFSELSKMKYSKLNEFLGSITIEDMQKLACKLEYHDYCEKHNIKYEDMTDYDFENAYLEKYSC